MSTSTAPHSPPAAGPYPAAGAREVAAGNPEAACIQAVYIPEVSNASDHADDQHKYACAPIRDTDHSNHGKQLKQK